MTMVKLLLTISILCLVVVTASAQRGKNGKKGRICNSENIIRQNCNPSKAGRWCVPRVVGAKYDWVNVKPTSFIVSWKGVATAKCYYIEVLTGYTSLPFKTISCFRGTTFKVAGLTPWQVYGFRVSAVNRMCKRGPPSSPVIRIKTFWSPAVRVNTPPPRQVHTPKVGACGRNFFTCTAKKNNKKQCIPKRKYCDEILQCSDGSDERKCPGGCKELNVEFMNGNYSCSRWGSPGSFCFFDCRPGYTRDGAQYTRCIKRVKKWSNPLPTCRLKRTRIMRILPEESTPTSVTVEWEPVEHTVNYAFQAVEQIMDDRQEEFSVSAIVNATDCCRTVIEGLKPNAEYHLSMFAVDGEGLRGMESLPVFFTSHVKSTDVKKSEVR